jgi:ketosteroid isomerase-like protein
MSQENVELVHRTMEEFNRNGAAAPISRGFISPEVVFDARRAGIPGIGVARGADEVRRVFEEDWFSAFPFEEWEIQIEDPVDHGDQVIFKSRQQGRGASSGAAAALELWNVFTIRDGEVVRMEVYTRREDALEAAGLSE